MASAGRTPLVHEIMTRDPMVVRADDDLVSVLALFDGRDFNAVPVVDVEGYLLGVVTKLSLLRMFHTASAAGASDVSRPPDLRVRDVMDTRNVWVETADDLNALLRQMTRYLVRSVPVVQRSGRRRRLVGMVSRGDLLRGLARPHTSN